MSEYQYQFYGRRIIANIPLPATPYTETSGIGYSSAIRVEAVSYTHLDVYKRQVSNNPLAFRICRPVPQIMILPLSVTSTFFFILNVRKIRPTSVLQLSLIHI